MSSASRCRIAQHLRCQSYALVGSVLLGFWCCTRCNAWIIAIIVLPGVNRHCTHDIIANTERPRCTLSQPLDTILNVLNSRHLLRLHGHLIARSTICYTIVLIFGARRSVRCRACWQDAHNMSWSSVHNLLATEYPVWTSESSCSQTCSI